MGPFLKSCLRGGFGLALAGAMIATPLTPALTADAPKPDPHRQQCFYASNINNYTTAGDRVVYLRVGVADVYRLDLMTDCPGLDFRQRIDFSRAVVGSSICSAIDLTIRFDQAGARSVCPVSDLRKLTPGEIAALPKRERP